MILIYSGISVNGEQEYNGAKGWTREHIWAKSRGDFGISIGAGRDVHALRPFIKNTNNINVYALPSGVYTICISDGVRQTNRKFIKN